MTDSERIDWLQAKAATVLCGSNYALKAESFAVCAPTLTGWVTRPTLREAVDVAAAQEARFHGGEPGTSPKLLDASRGP